MVLCSVYRIRKVRSKAWITLRVYRLPITVDPHSNVFNFVDALLEIRPETDVKLQGTRKNEENYAQ